MRKWAGSPVESIPEDKKAAEVRELKTYARYADSVEKAKNYTERMKNKIVEAVPTVKDGATEYVPEISISAKGDRLLSLSLKEDKISIFIDGLTAVKDLTVSNTQPGLVFLETAWGGYGWSQRNLADDVYDGVFEKLIITENTGADKEKILYDGRLYGFKAFKYNAKKLWEDMINWSLGWL